MAKLFRFFVGGPKVQIGQTAITAMTDNSGGSASSTVAAITAGASYAQADMTAVKNAIASLSAKQNLIIAALKAAGITS